MRGGVFMMLRQCVGCRPPYHCAQKNGTGFSGAVVCAITCGADIYSIASYFGSVKKSAYAGVSDI
jgi:hypothetical protein